MSWNWIEASAGTGKTYALTQLFLRMVAERGIPAEKILLVTFTEKATLDLKTKIRSALNDEIFRLRGLGPQNAEATSRLEAALENSAELNITTIHGFCRGLLTSYPLETRTPFQTRVVDQTEVWRRNLRSLLRQRPDLVPVHRLEDAGIADSQDLIQRSLEALQAGVFGLPVFEPSPETLHRSENLRSQTREASSPLWRLVEESRKQLLPLPEDWKAAFSPPEIEVFSGTTIKVPYRALRKFVLCEDEEELLNSLKELPALLRRWDPENSPSVFKKGKGSVPGRIIVFQEAAQMILPLLENLISGWDVAPAQVLQSCASYLLLQDLCLAQGDFGTPGELTYDTMIEKVFEMTAGTRKSAALVEAVRARYDVALIDEFQDTDRRQWGIFSSLFEPPEKLLTLVGDPKQAIYGFRGADLAVYRQARRQAENLVKRLGGEFTVLKQNYRSTEPMIRAVNTLFTPLFSPDGFTPNEKGEKDIAVVKRRTSAGDQVRPPLTFLNLEEELLPYWDLVLAKQVLSLLDGSHFLEDSKGTRQVNPADLLILTDQHSVSQRIFRRLAEKNVPAVVQGASGVFQTREAAEILTFLKALENPRGVSEAKAILLTSLFELRPSDLLEETPDLEAVQDALLSVQDLRRKGGYLQAFRRVCDSLKNPPPPEPGALENLLVKDGGERRWTNFFHVLEILQEAVQSGRMTADRAAAYLESRRDGSKELEEEIDLRLDRDGQAVRIMTVYAAKGLEAPIVLHAEGLSRSRTASPWYVFNSETAQERVVDFLKTDKGKELRALDEKSERLRLYYVALTRASSLQILPGTAGSRHKWGEFLSVLEQISLDPAEIERIPVRVPSRHEFELLAPYREAISFPRKIFQAKLPLSPPHLRHPWVESHSGLVRRLGNREEASLARAYVSELNAVRETDEEALPALPGSDLPAGPAFGTLVHDVLEAWDYEAARPESLLPSTSSSNRKILENALEVARNAFPPQKDLKKRLFDWLVAALQVEIVCGNVVVRLCDLPTKNTRREVEFHLLLALKKEKTLLWEGLDQAAGDRTDFTVHPGYLTGKIDLLFEKSGQLFLLDWKTNRLTPGETIEGVMRKSFYDLQALWYWEAMNLLMGRQGEELVPGGVIFFFLRGKDGKPEAKFFSPDFLDGQSVLKPFLPRRETDA